MALRATGQVVRFDGFLTLYQEGRDEDAEDEEGGRLPPMAEGDRLTEHGIAAEQHFTEPPPRYTEATLIKKMEELGIGRPSTYASTLSVLRDRGYVRLDKRQLIPEDKGRLVTAFLESFFERYVEYDFTADLEEKLDKISNGDLSWKEVLRDFWRQFSADVDETKDLRVSEVLEVAERAARPAHLPGARRRRRSAPVPDLRHRPAVAEARQVRRLHRLLELSRVPLHPPARRPRRERQGADFGADGKLLGTDPETGLNVTLRTGRFGPYVQLGEAGRGQGREAEARQHPEGWDAGDDRPRAGAGAPLAAARGRAPSRDRQADHRRHRPLRPVRAARRHLRQSRLGRGRIHRRPQPRGHAARRERPAADAAAGAARRRP